jgi:hypothetical protein
MNLSLSITIRQKFMLAVLSSGGEGASYTPVHVQKLFFLIDREAAPLLGRTHFAFKPYDYGPFDRSVYDELDYLAQVGLVLIAGARFREYHLSSDGLAVGTAELHSYSPQLQHFFCACSSWVRSLDFQQLVSAIYVKYPDMKVNSVFKG